MLPNDKILYEEWAEAFKQSPKTLKGKLTWKRQVRRMARRLEQQDKEARGAK